jgi:cell division protein FtsI/penicillin-binding protein 2
LIVSHPYKEFLDVDGKVKSDIRNKSITDNIEPGSVIKPITVAAALDLGKITGAYEYDDNGLETKIITIKNGKKETTLISYKSDNQGKRIKKYYDGKQTR